MDRYLDLLTLYRPALYQWVDSIRCLIKMSMNGPKKTHKKHSENQFFLAELSFDHRCPVKNVTKVKRFS
jgi:hypothetical protein